MAARYRWLREGTTVRSSSFKATPIPPPSPTPAPTTPGMTPDKTAKTLKGAAVFFAAAPSKSTIVAAQQAGAIVVAELTPNTHIMVGVDDNQLIQEAEDNGVHVWSQSDFLIAASPAPPPPPGPGSRVNNLSRKTVFVRRFPALPGDVSSDDGLAAPLAYSWYDGASSAEIEAGLRLLVGAGSEQLLELLTANGGIVAISSGLPSGALLTLRVADIVEPSAPPAHLLDTMNSDFEVTCTASPRPAADEHRGELRRSLPSTLRSAIQKRRREVGPDPRWCEHVLAAHEEFLPSAEHRPDKMRKTRATSAAEMLTTPITDVLASVSKIDEEAALKLAEERGEAAAAEDMKKWAADEAAEDDEGGREDGEDSEEAGVVRLRKMVAAVQTVVTTVTVTMATAAKKVSAMQKKTTASRPAPRPASTAATPAALLKRAERWMPRRSGAHTGAEEPLMSQPAEA